MTNNGSVIGLVVGFADKIYRNKELEMKTVIIILSVVFGFFGLIGILTLIVYVRIKKYIRARSEMVRLGTELNYIPVVSDATGKNFPE